MSSHGLKVTTRRVPRSQHEAHAVARKPNLPNLPIICAFILAVGINQPFLVLIALVCVVAALVDDEALCLFS
jgi:hypothetical protein